MKPVKDVFGLCLFALIALIALMPASSRATGLKTLCRLPAVAAESSGIELTGPNEIWTLNDSGGLPELYRCDTLGNLVQTVAVNGAENADWEDLARDDAGNFYIADVGNNNNDRQNLRIYKVPNPKTAINGAVDAQIITLRYDDQTEFPPPADELNFDCEALAWHAGYLYLFSKNRTLPVKTSLYRVPDQPGDYVAAKMGTFDTGGNSTDDADLYSYWITAAAFSPDGSRLALLSHDRIWLFYQFTGDDFFGGKLKIEELDHSSQKESVAFADNSTLYLTDEYWSFIHTGGNLYRFGLAGLDDADSTALFRISPNPFNSKTRIESEVLTEYRLQLFDSQGRAGQVFTPDSNHFELDLTDFPAGLYVVRFSHKTNGSRQSAKLLKQ